MITTAFPRYSADDPVTITKKGPREALGPAQPTTWLSVSPSGVR
jgi:hypothetical protein